MSNAAITLLATSEAVVTTCPWSVHGSGILIFVVSKDAPALFLKLITE